MFAISVSYKLSSLDFAFFVPLFMALYAYNVPPLLWHCWLAIRMSMRPVDIE